MNYYIFIGIILVLSGEILAIRNRFVTKGDNFQLICPCDRPVWFGPPNHTLYAAGNDVVESLEDKISVKNEFGNSSLQILDFSSDNQGNYSCAAVDCLNSYMLKYVSKFDITYSYTREGSLLKCLPDEMLKNFTYLVWDHLSFNHEHIRYLEGTRSGELKLEETLGETDRHHDAGIYVCRINSGLLFDDDSLLSSEYLLNVTGRPFFVSANNDIQSYVIDQQQIQLFVYVVSIPEYKTVTVVNKNMLAIESKISAAKNVKTYDIVYGRRITVSADNISMFIQSTESNMIQQYTVTVTNGYGSGSYNISVTPNDTRLASLFPQKTHVLILIIIIVLALFPVSAGTYKGVSALYDYIRKYQREAPNLQNELAEDIRQYDEIDIPYMSHNDSLSVQQIIQQTETRIQFPSTSLDSTEVTNDKSVDPTMCLSEVDGIFKTLPSSLSTNSSDISYLSPCGQYTELKQIGNTTFIPHYYEKIQKIYTKPDTIESSADLRQDQTCVKHWTI